MVGSNLMDLSLTVLPFVLEGQRCDPLLRGCEGETSLAADIKKCVAQRNYLTVHTKGEGGRD